MQTKYLEAQMKYESNTERSRNELIAQEDFCESIIYYNLFILLYVYSL